MQTKKMQGRNKISLIIRLPKANNSMNSKKGSKTALLTETRKPLYHTLATMRFSRVMLIFLFPKTIKNQYNQESESRI